MCCISIVVADCGFSDIENVLKEGYQNANLPAFLVDIADFTGKLRFKLLYDGLKVSRFRVPIEAECTEKQDDNQSSEDQP